MGLQVERLTEATFQAVAHYEVQRYPGTLLNCIASKRPIPDGTRDTRNELPLLAESGSETVHIPAENSGHLFVSPNVEELAGHIQRYLARASGSAVNLDVPRERACEP